eukprot:scaffold200234_cov17-Tisochrysis_lutea.AAC.1
MPVCAAAPTAANAAVPAVDAAVTHAVWSESRSRSMDFAPARKKPSILCLDIHSWPNNATLLMLLPLRTVLDTKLVGLNGANMA